MNVLSNNKLRKYGAYLHCDEDYWWLAIQSGEILAKGTDMGEKELVVLEVELVAHAPTIVVCHAVLIQSNPGS